MKAWNALEQFSNLDDFEILKVHSRRQGKKWFLGTNVRIGIRKGQRSNWAVFGPYLQSFNLVRKEEYKIYNFSWGIINDAHCSTSKKKTISSLSLFVLLWNWFKFKPAILKSWNETIDTVVEISPARTGTGKHWWRPIFKLRTSISTNWPVPQADVLPWPALTAKILVFHFQLKERVHHWLACYLLSQALEHELLVSIVAVAGQHLEAEIFEICFTRFDQAEALTWVILRPQSVISVKLPLLISVVVTGSSIWRMFCCCQICQTPVGKKDTFHLWPGYECSGFVSSLYRK